jgi:hypothetical protein
MRPHLQRIFFYKSMPLSPYSHAPKRHDVCTVERPPECTISLNYFHRAKSECSFLTLFLPDAPFLSNRAINQDSIIITAYFAGLCFDREGYSFGLDFL